MDGGSGNRAPDDPFLPSQPQPPCWPSPNLTNSSAAEGSKGQAPGSSPGASPASRPASTPAAGALPQPAAPLARPFPSRCTEPEWVHSQASQELPPETDLEGAGPEGLLGNPPGSCPEGSCPEEPVPTEILPPVGGDDSDGDGCGGASSGAPDPGTAAAAAALTAAPADAARILPAMAGGVGAGGGAAPGVLWEIGNALPAAATLGGSQGSDGGGRRAGSAAEAAARRSSGSSEPLVQCAQPSRMPSSRDGASEQEGPVAPGGGLGSEEQDMPLTQSLAGLPDPGSQGGLWSGTAVMTVKPHDRSVQLA